MTPATWVPVFGIFFLARDTGRRRLDDFCFSPLHWCIVRCRPHYKYTARLAAFRFATRQQGAQIVCIFCSYGIYALLVVDTEFDVVFSGVLAGTDCTDENKRVDCFLVEVPQFSVDVANKVITDRRRLWLIWLCAGILCKTERFGDGAAHVAKRDLPRDRPARRR